MNRIFYLSGLQVLIAILLIFFLLPTIIMYVILPLIVLGLALSLFFWARAWLKKSEIFSGREPKVYRYDAASGPVIDVQAERE